MTTKTADRKQIERDSLQRARTERSFANYPLIIEGFAARGIPVEDIRPRENVFTFNAWRALGRTVCKGERGLKIPTMVPIEKKSEENGEEKIRRFTRPGSATVFHVSQTKPLTE